MVSYQPSVSERQAIPNSLSLGSCQLSVTWSGTDWWIYWRLLLTKENLKWLGLSIAQSPQKLLNLLQTNFKAASGTVEMLTDLLADLESLPSLITLSGEPEAGGRGVWEEVMEGVLTLTPRNAVRHELWVWHIGNPRCRQALLWHLGRRSVYITQKVECSMHSPKDLPRLAPSSKKYPYKNKSDLAEIQAGMKTYTGRKLAPSEPTEPLEISPFV